MDDLARGDGLLWALRFDGGIGKPAETFDFAVVGDGWCWGHFALADIRTRLFLRRIEVLPEAARELLESDEARLQLHHEHGWSFGVLPDLERDLDGATLGAGRLRFAMNDRLLITARQHPLRVIDDVRRQAHTGYALASPPEAFVRLVERFAEVMETRLEVLGDQIDEIEDRVLGGSVKADAIALGPLRRELAGARREFSGLRTAFHRSGQAREGRRTSGPLSGPISELAPVIEDADREASNLQDRGRLLHEELDTLISGATNQTMRALTVMSTLLIPPTLIVGAFGMNVPGIPFAHSPLGFGIASGICLVVVLAAYQLLRRLDLLP